MGIDEHRWGYIKNAENRSKIGQNVVLEQNKRHHDVQRHLIIRGGGLATFFWQTRFRVSGWAVRPNLWAK